MEHYLVYKILKKMEQSSVDWKRDSQRKHTIQIQQFDYGKKNERKRQLTAEAIRLEEAGRIKCKWLSYHEDLGQMVYADDDKDFFYEKAGKRPKYLRIQEYRSELENRLRKTSRLWNRSYYEALDAKLEKGVIPKEFEYSLSKGKEVTRQDLEQCFQKHRESEGVFLCLEELDRLTEPIYQRVFSKKCFRGSTVFEQEYRSRIAEAYAPWDGCGHL